MAGLSVSVDNLPEDDLLRDARRGSKGAVVDLMRRYEPALRRLIRQRLDRRCRTKIDPEDVLQELYLAFLKKAIKPEVFACQRSFSNYLFCAALSKAQEVNRKFLAGEKRNAALETSASTEPADRHVPEYVENELWDDAIDLLHHLPWPESEVYFMLFLKGKPWQIARRMQLPLREIYRRIGVAQKRLRARLWSRKRAYYA